LLITSKLQPPDSIKGFPEETRLQQVCQGDKVSLPHNPLKDTFWLPGKICCDYKKKKGGQAVRLRSKRESQIP